ncbi:hypothetical protein N0V88_003569 [Collariella sp. IMI 366227]|nr:hypothetical protein N0V88_003569 [Collariella sp. IMI 366227]
MPSILSDDDRETVKRFVPKQTNKIHAVAVARLYVAYPNRSKWTYTGLQGAVVLANDLVGNTYWIKMVDISLEECLAGLSFVDEKEAKQFLKKMNDREKNATKATVKTLFGGSAPASHQKHHHGLFGGLFGHRHSSAPSPPESQRVPVPTRDHRSGSMNGYHEPAAPSGFEKLDAFNPQWREQFGEDLRSKGLTDDFIRENQDFIVDFLRQEQAAQAKQPLQGEDQLLLRPRPLEAADLCLLPAVSSRPIHTFRLLLRFLPRLLPRHRSAIELTASSCATGQRPGPSSSSAAVPFIKCTASATTSSPLPSSGAPPAPPRRRLLLSPISGGYSSSVPAPALPAGGDTSRAAVLDSIRGAGGIASLKKVDRSQIRDRSAATVGGAGGDTVSHGSGLPAAGVGAAGGGGMADALAAALQKRKEKVSRSDDEADDDDW